MLMSECNIYFSLATVNLKKDSENTPVKGGIMADLGTFVCEYVQFSVNSVCIHVISVVT